MAVYREGGPIGTPHKKRFKRFLPFLIGIVIATSVTVGALWWLSLDTSPAPAVTSEVVDLGEYTPNQTIETEWFRFDVPKSWTYEADLSKPNMFVYKDIVGDDPTGLLTIYVNSQPLASTTDNQFTNVVPVSIRDQTKLTANLTSEHCKTAVPNKASRDPQPVTFESVSFLCLTDGTNFYAVAGEVDGTQTLTMLRRDLSEATYVITYKNIGFNENRQALQRLLNTFESR